MTLTIILRRQPLFITIHICTTHSLQSTASMNWILVSIYNIYTTSIWLNLPQTEWHIPLWPSSTGGATHGKMWLLMPFIPLKICQGWQTAPSNNNNFQAEQHNAVLSYFSTNIWYFYQCIFPTLKLQNFKILW